VTIKSGDDRRPPTLGNGKTEPRYIGGGGGALGRVWEGTVRKEKNGGETLEGSSRHITKEGGVRPASVGLEISCNYSCMTHILMS
jgi:hypothetical protein